MLRLPSSSSVNQPTSMLFVNYAELLRFQLQEDSF